MAGYKTFANLEVLTAADVNGYLMSQVIPRFASTTARNAAIGSPEADMVCNVTGVGLMQYQSGAWTRLVPLPPGGTTGQVLAKTSGTDFAVGWVTP